MDPETRRRRLLEKTRRTFEQRTAAREERLAARKGEPPGVGDVFAAPNEERICWLVLMAEEEVDEYFVVPLDNNPLYGSGDVKVVHDVADPWIARCRFAGWVVADVLNHRVDVLQVSEAERVRSFCEYLDVETPGNLLQKEVDVETEYLAWVGKAVEPAGEPNPPVLRKSESEIADLLLAWNQGDESARDRLILRMQDELRAMARGHLGREKRDVTVETLDLVQELILRLLDRNSVAWTSGAHFRGTASVMMYHILVDYAKKRASAKRNRGIKPIPLDRASEIAEERDDYLIALHDALSDLERTHPEQHEVLVRHYFGGQTRLEIAEDMNVAEVRVNRHLRAGRAFLRELLDGEWKRGSPGL